MVRVRLPLLFLIHRSASVLRDIRSDGCIWPFMQQERHMGQKGGNSTLLYA